MLLSCWDTLVSMLLSCWDTLVSMLLSCWDTLVSMLLSCWDTLVSMLLSCWKRTFRFCRFLTVDVAAVFPQELQSVRVVVLHGLRHVDDVSVSVVISAGRTFYL